MPPKFPRNSCKIGQFFHEFVPKNPAQFDFFSHDLSEALFQATFDYQYKIKIVNHGIIFFGWSHLDTEYFKVVDPISIKLVPSIKIKKKATTNKEKRFLRSMSSTVFSSIAYYKQLVIFLNILFPISPIGKIRFFLKKKIQGFVPLQQFFLHSLA